jgi:hypothetical protein
MCDGTETRFLQDSELVCALQPAYCLGTAVVVLGVDHVDDYWNRQRQQLQQRDLPCAWMHGGTQTGLKCFI